MRRGITTRRQFLRASLAALVPLSLAACGTSGASAPPGTAVPPAATVATAANTPVVAPTTNTSAAAPAKAATLSGLPQVYIWSNMINHDPAQGTQAAKLKEVQQYIADQVHVEPVAYLPPVDQSTADTKLNLLLGSGDQQLDIFQGNWDAFQQVVLPIGDLLNTAGSAIRPRFSQENWAKMTDADGKVWGIPRLAVQLAAHPIWLRTDWLQELKLAPPATLDDLEKALAAFKQRNPNAVLATSSLGDFRYATVGGFTELGYSNWLDKSDNRLKPPELQAGFQDWVAKMADWYKKGWLYKDTFANPGIPRDEALVKTGNLGVWAGWYSRVTLYFNSRDNGAVPGMRFDFSKQGIKGPQGQLQTFSPGGTAAILINKKSKDPERAMRFLNWQYQDVEHAVTAVYGVPNKDWKWADDQHYFVDRLNAGKPDQYAGEYMCCSGPWSESHFSPTDKLLKEHNLFIRDDIYDYSAGKSTVDAPVPYNVAEIQKQVPGLADLSRLIDEEMTKFITGVRPLNEWNGFLGQLKSAGLDAWSTAYTAQYLKLKK